MLPKVGEAATQGSDQKARVAGKVRFVNHVKSTGNYQVVIKGHRDMHRVV